jgi:hypothetical protein
MHPLIYVTFSLFNNLESNITNLLYHIHTYLKAAIFCSTSRIGLSQPCPEGRLTPSSCLGPCCQLGSVYSSPRHQHLLCSNGSYITRSTLTPYNRVLTLSYKKTPWICDTTCKYLHVHNLKLFFSFFFLTSSQVSWSQTLMSGTVMTSAFCS